jgi:hypothetical protein
MGLPQSNQQTPFIGYPQNQLYTPEELRWRQETERQFLDWGNWQPGMTRTDQFMAPPDPSSYGELGQQDYARRTLNNYYDRVGTPYAQSQRQSYWQQMGGQVYGGVIPPPRDPITNQQVNPASVGDPWSTLNNMGISSAYGMPAWQQQQFGSANATPGGGQDPAEQFSNMPFPNSSYGIPNSFSPVTPNYATAQQPQSAANPGMGSQSPSPWGSNLGSRDSPWGNPSNWGSQNYMWGW